MSNRRKGIQAAYVASGLVVAFMALAMAYALSTFGHAEAGMSVHVKNSDTPGWILELETRQARQLPPVLQPGEPSFWI